MISKAGLREYMEKDLDSFRWMKRLTERQLRKEFRETYGVQPHFKTTPWLHQLVCFHIGMLYPEFLFLLDMGLGKTKILLDIMTQRIREGTMKRAIITVPRLINLGSWEEAILEHSDLEPNIVSATNIDEKTEMLLHPKGQVTVIDYAGLQNTLSSKAVVKGKKKLVKDDRKVLLAARQHDFFGMDESHKAKNRDTLRFSLLRGLTGKMKARYATTGTMFGRNPEDIWAQFFLVDRGETLGDTLGMFRAAFFTEDYSNKWKMGADYKFNKGMMRDLYRRLQHRSLRYDEDECLDIPERSIIPIKLAFPTEQREHYLRAVQGLIQAAGKLRELDSNYLRMRQIVAGFLQWKDDSGPHEVVFSENPKLQAIERLVEEAGNSKVVISHEYTKSGELITGLLDRMEVGYEWLHGGSKDPINAVRRFIEDPNKRVFVMNSESGGTGTDGLQKVAKYLVFFECPPSPISRAQVIKRVHRPGQLHKSFIYDLIIEGSIDRRILSFIAEGRNLHQAVINGDFGARSLLLP